MEFAVDPLFKKASADFDEGGAKGLLLNHLSIDSEGRIVFDSSDDAGDVTTNTETTRPPEDAAAENNQSKTVDKDMIPNTAEQDQEIDLDSLAVKFFPDLSILDTQDICPSMKSFALGDPSSDLTIPFLKPPEDWRDAHKDKSSSKAPGGDLNLNPGDQTGIFLNDGNAAGFDDDDGGLLCDFDLPPNTGFGEGGEAWAKDAALEPMLRVSQADEEAADTGVAVGDFDPANPHGDAYTVSLNHREGTEHENILSYFDDALKSQKAGWAGPEHWRIRKIKKMVAANGDGSNSGTGEKEKRTRKEKEPLEIDFLAPMDKAMAEVLYTMASSNSAISLPKSQWKTKGRNLLPDDKYFNSRSLLSLFLKPNARLGRRTAVAGLPARERGTATSGGAADGEYEEMDEAYWARRREEELRSDEGRKGDYDANFFADDDAGLPFVGGLPDDEDDDDQGPAGFTDAREMLSPPPSTVDGPGSDSLPGNGERQGPSQSDMAAGSFGSQLVTQAGRRLRPEYVNYARVAKKVDVRRLKENMWKGMADRLVASIDGGEDSPAETTGPPTPAPTEPDPDVEMMDVDVPEPIAQQQQQQDHGKDKAPELKFTSLINDLTHVYPEAQMKDISTSYCFICLLHLANEKGLVLEGGRGDDGAGDAAVGGMTEIRVMRDLSVGEGYVGE